MHAWVLGVLIASFSLGISGAPAKGQSPPVSLSVVGQGDSIDEARNDAIRKALQLAMKQLVIVDRAVSANAVLRDRIMSTMNGYIEAFQQENLVRTAGGFSMAASITISASRIENFIGLTTAVGGSVAGSAILGEQSRRVAQMNAESLQAQARGEIFDRLFRGFPTDAVEVRVISTSLSATNHEIIDVHIEVSYKRLFIKALEDTIRALGGTACAPQPLYFNPHIPVEMILDSTQSASCSPVSQSKNIVCLGYGTGASGHGVKCYGLPPGDYCVQCKLRGWAQYFIILSQFIDSVGQPANTRGSCIESVAIRGPAIFNPATKDYRFSGQALELYFKHGESQGRRYTAIGLDMTPKRLVVEIPTQYVDLARANQMVAIAALGSSGFQGIWRDQSQQQWTTDLLGSASDSRTSCGKLDEAVQRQMITSQR